ncbi:MAG: glycine cleavage system protein R [Myxococcota bacterium]
MNAALVLTVIGPDRPGLVEALSQTVAAHGANWLESRLAHLSGHFAGMVRVSVPEDRAEELAAALGRLDDLRILVETAGDADAGEGRHLTLELLGQDRPGIVREVSSALAARGVNVEELETECTPAPMSGETLFRARARLRLPADTAEAELREALEKLGDELMVDVTFEE